MHKSFTKTRRSRLGNDKRLKETERKWWEISITGLCEVKNQFRASEGRT